MQPTPQMDAAWAWLARIAGSSSAPGVQSGGPIKQALYKTMIGGNHFDHIHVALQQALASNPEAVARIFAEGGKFVGGGMPGRRQRIDVKAPGSRLRGAPGALSGRAQQLYAGGLELSINKRLGRVSGGLGNLGRGQLSREQIEGLWTTAGGPAGLAGLMANVAWSESRWNPRARNPSGASGLWQMTMPLHQGLVSASGGDVFDPLTNARVAVKLWRSAGMSPWAASQGVWSQRNSAPGEARGGRIPAFRNGGSFVTAAGRGQAFMAGDNPYRREQVKVTPLRPRQRSATGVRSLGGGGANVAVHVNFNGGVSVRSNADIEAIARRTADIAGRKILAALGDGISDTEVSG